jgi:hypothetical protein
MSFANTSISDIVATTLRNRSKEIADNVTKNNAVLAQLKKSGNVRKVSGGSEILEPLSFSENGNVSWYSGYDTLSTSPSDVLSAASFSLKQLACPVVVSGLEKLQNAGKEQLIDLIDGRTGVAEATMANNLAQGVYADGTGFGGKQLTGLGAAVVASPSTGTYGGIDRATWSFWRNQTTGSLGSVTSSNIGGYMNALWVKLVRGKNRPKLIIADNNMYSAYEASLQALQRFTDTDDAGLGFPSIKYKDARVVLDGGIGGFCPTNVMYFLNTDYLFFRPHKDRDMVPLAPSSRAPTNQDAEVTILAWAGAMTCSGAQFQGYFQGS